MATEFICPRCKEYVIDEDRRYHPCSREGVTVPAVYIPNAAKMTKSDSAAYRKHAGSRDPRQRRTRWTPEQAVGFLTKVATGVLVPTLS